jgi:alanine racemase
MILFSQLEEITKGKIISLSKDRVVSTLITDSRKAIISEESVFFAIKGEHHDGHDYIEKLYSLGVRQFIVEKNQVQSIPLNEANILLVASCIDALQAIVAVHRTTIHVPTIGITGSNGKTIIKEWLYQLLSEDYKIAKNPGSYNSQLGVPLSVWQLQQHHQIGLFEAGISKPGEMIKLAHVIQPTIGIISNIGSAHNEGFSNLEQKVNEKLKLFTDSEIVIYCRDHTLIHDAITILKLNGVSWGFNNNADIRIRKQTNHHHFSHKGDAFDIQLPFVDQASIENCLHCVALMIQLGYSGNTIAAKLKMLRSIPMRLELKEGINQCQVVDDTYNNDLAGLQISLDFLSNQHQKKKKRVILSDVLESGLQEEELAKKIASLLSTSRVDKFIGIGKSLLANKKHFYNDAVFFETTDDFLNNFDTDSLQQEIILVKGARKFEFEKIANRLQRKVHGTIMEIDLGAVIHNLNYFKSRLKPTTKIMTMVKAFAYGSGSTEVANVLQYHKIDYLGVAYADEGVELRKNNITLPIMVMNPTEESFDTLTQFRLEPEIYSFRILESYLKHLDGRLGVVHLKLDTGMHRLGFDEKDVSGLISSLIGNPNISVASVFSHLAGADESEHDNFSAMQASHFKTMADSISKALGYKPLYHILNSPGILRLPEFQFDMVRLGIGLYGIDPTHEKFIGLKPVATLKTIISQIKEIPEGETIGYGRKGKAEANMRIATIAIGYADGFSRAFSKGVGSVIVNGQQAKVIGNVCMDMTMVDVTQTNAQEGDEVIVFGKELPIQSLALRINTIPYEILTSTSERVKRVFVAESI